MGDHNSAPQANQTPRFKQSGSLKLLENTFSGRKCVSSAPFFPWPGVSILHAYTDQAQAARAEAWGSMRRMQARAPEERGCARPRQKRGSSAACLQRMYASGYAEAPQDSRRRGIGSLRTCMRSGSSPSDGEAPEACAVRQLPSSTWCVDASLQLRSSRLINPLIGIF